MKNLIRQFRQFYAIPREIPDRFVISHLLVLIVFFFTLGFMVSQVIILLHGK